MRLSRFLLAASLLFGAALLPARADDKPKTGFIDKTFKNADGSESPYVVYVPKDYDGTKESPTILFLHGAGETGSDGKKQVKVGLGPEVKKHAKDFPCIVVFPQAHQKSLKDNPKSGYRAMEILAEVRKEYKVDPDRIYLTGLSMGGYGTWEMTAKYPGRFAAYVPICGGIHGPPGKPEVSVGVAKDPQINDPYAETARRIGSTPIWIFHGGADSVVPVEESRKMAAALQAAKANVRYTEYPGVDHNSWDKAYAEPELVPWLLAQKLNR